MANPFEKNQAPAVPENSEEENSFEESAENEVHPYEQELYQLVGSPEADNTKIEVTKTDTNEPGFKMRKTIEPREDEKELLPEGSTMELTMQGTRKQEKNNNLWEINEAEFEMDGNKLTLEDIIPEDCKLVLNESEVNAYIPAQERNPQPTITLNSLNNIDDVVTLLHEAGHAHDKRPGVPMPKVPAQIDRNWMKEQSTKMTINRQKRERDAWATAHHIARQAKWPVQKIIRNQSALCMATYDAKAAHILIDGTTPDQFASSEQRRAMKKPEKQQEAKQLRDLEQYTQIIPEVVSDYTGIKLNRIYKHNRISENEDASVRFEVPDEKKHYRVDMTHHDSGAKSISIIERDDQDNITILDIYGARIAQVMEDKTGNANEEAIPRLENIWEGKMGVLAADEYSDKPEETYQKAREILSRFTRDKILKRMITEMFRQRYPGTPEPPEKDAQTGEKLRFEDQIEYMKKHSETYEFMKDAEERLDDIVSEYQRGK